MEISREGGGGGSWEKRPWVFSIFLLEGCHYEYRNLTIYYFPTDFLVKMGFYLHISWHVLSNDQFFCSGLGRQGPLRESDGGRGPTLFGSHFLKRFFVHFKTGIKWNVVTTLCSNFNCCIALGNSISAKTTTLWQTERFDYDTSEEACQLKTTREMAYSKVVIILQPRSVYWIKAGVTTKTENENISRNRITAENLAMLLLFTNVLWILKGDKKAFSFLIIHCF